MPRAVPPRRKAAARQAVPRWKRRKEARPAEIVAAGLELFVERGFAATRLFEVARRAGVTKGTLYLYFESKDALFKAVVRETIVPAIAEGERLAKAHQGPAADLLRQLLGDWWRGMNREGLSGIPKLVMAEAGNFPELARFYSEEVVKRGHQLVGSILKRGVARGEFRSLDVPMTVKLAFAPLIHATNWRHSFALCIREGFDPERYLASHLDIFLRGISRDSH